MLKMLFPNGCRKAVTLSYDDGLYCDERLMQIMHKNGVKGTFNMGSGTFRKEGEPVQGMWCRMTIPEAKELFKQYPEMEVAWHGLTHADITKLSRNEMMYEVIADKANLENEFETIVRGGAYAFGTNNAMAVEVLKEAGIKYCRTCECHGGFGMPKNWLLLPSTCHHNNPKLMELAEKFVNEQPENAWEPWLFYVWGHTSEFDRDNNWEVIEKFCECVGGKEDIWYATNIEICEYVEAFNSLIYSTGSKKMVYNPTAKEIWLTTKHQFSYSAPEKIVSVKPGETIIL